MSFASTTLAPGGGWIFPGGSTAAMRSPVIAMSRTAGRGSGASGSKTRAPRTISVQVTSVRVEHVLVFGERLLDGLSFLFGGMLRIGGGRRAAAGHQAGPQQQPG